MAFLRLPDLVQNHVLDENRHGFQDERHEQMDVDVVSGAVQLPVEAEKHSEFSLQGLLLIKFSFSQFDQSSR